MGRSNEESQLMLNGRRKVVLNILKGRIQLFGFTIILCAYDVYFFLLLCDPFTPSPLLMESERNYGDNGLNPMSNQF